jgi:uncharacterized CHY-type Zn-finger protein
MKAVQVALKDGWETELWKIRRLFTGAEYSEAADKKAADLRIPFSCSDPQMGPTGKYGFPDGGFTLELLVPNTYSSGKSISNVRVSKVRSNNPDMVGPDRIDAVIRDLFMQAFANQTTLHIFNSMKVLDRTLPDAWIRAAMSQRVQKRENPDGLNGEKVGSLHVSSVSPYMLTLIEASLVCLKCEHHLDTLKLSQFDGSFEEQWPCPTCDRQLSVSVSSGGEIRGVDCAISHIKSISLWLFCNCGQDCAYYHKIPASGPKNPFAFTCGCPTTKPTIEFKCTVNLPKRKKNPLSPQLGADSSPVKTFKQGVALPMNGACKHYKKSFRWLQYQCCKEWYACNLCHDARASNHERSEDDASVMMCGFCSFQQPIIATCTQCEKETNPGWSMKERVTTDVRGRRKKYRHK